jgi:hypothetical protein
MVIDGHRFVWKLRTRTIYATVTAAGFHSTRKVPAPATLDARGAGLALCKAIITERIAKRS